MKRIAVLIMAVAFAGAAPAQTHGIERDKGPAECMLRFQAPVGTWVLAGELRSTKTPWVIDLYDPDRSIAHGPMGATTCRDDPDWHCIISGAFTLYVPRSLEEGVDAWERDGILYLFMASESFRIGESVLELRPLVAYRIHDGEPDPYWTFFFDPHMSLVGYASYHELVPDADGQSRTIPVNYWLIGKEAPLTCY